jgi:hypothetical protein
LTLTLPDDRIEVPQMGIGTVVWDAKRGRVTVETVG